MKKIRRNLFEAELNLPQEYIQKVRDDAEEKFGFTGPSRNEMQRMGHLLNNIFVIQRGHEDELTELGKTVINKFYGSMLDGVKLDIKIVNPDDPEKLEMAQKMMEQPEEEEKEEPEMPNFEVETELKGIEHDIDKRKLINNIMQGEAQNVHDMMYDVKDQVTEITGNPELLDLYIEFLTLNRKFDWDSRINLEEMMEQAPEMANAMETEWEENEEGGDTPTIKARVLDLPMLIHETVKGIYELIAAGAVDPDPIRAKKVLAATDTLKDEQQDIRYGPYIATDLRDYVNEVSKKVAGAHDIPNLREFVFGQMIKMQSEEFVELITSILLKETWPEDLIINFIKKTLEEFKNYKKEDFDHSYGNEDDIENEIDDDEALPPGVEDFIDDFNTSSSPVAEEPVEEPVEDKKPNWSGMGKNELNFQLNKAIDDENWTAAQEIQKMIDRKKGVNRSTNESNEAMLKNWSKNNK